MRVKCANCGAIWEFITIWTAQNDEKCQGRPHQTGCPCCGSNAYEQVPEGTHRNSQEGTLETGEETPCN